MYHWIGEYKSDSRFWDRYWLTFLLFSSLRSGTLPPCTQKKPPRCQWDRWSWSPACCPGKENASRRKHWRWGVNRWVMIPHSNRRYWFHRTTRESDRMRDFVINRCRNDNWTRMRFLLTTRRYSGWTCSITRYNCHRTRILLNLVAFGKLLGRFYYSIMIYMCRFFWIILWFFQFDLQFRLNSSFLFRILRRFWILAQRNISVASQLLLI